MKFIKILSAALFLLAAGGTAQAQSALNDILNGGVLKVGTTGDWNPMTMKDVATNTYKGYDIDVMTELAKDLGVKVEFVPTDWKTLVSGVTSGKYHMTGSASISPARAKAAGYSDSYFSLATVPLVLAENADKFKDWEDLNKAGVSVALNATGGSACVLDCGQNQSRQRRDDRLAGATLCIVCGDDAEHLPRAAGPLRRSTQALNCWSCQSRRVVQTNARPASCPNTRLAPPCWRPRRRPA